LDGGYVIVGETSSYGNGASDVWLIKTDSQGQEEWNQTFGGNQNDIGYFVQQVEDGGFVLTGQTGSYGNGSKDVWLIKTDSQGQEEWNQTYGGSENDFWLLRSTNRGRRVCYCRGNKIIWKW
jgi:predicted secreted protein